MPSNTRVLVVDDEELIRTGLAEFLRVQGFVVEEVGTATSARARFASFQPEIILLDYLLPEGTALDLIPEFRDANPSVPIVVLTGHGTIDLAVTAIKLGAEQFLTKPIEFDSLLITLRRILDNQSYKRRVAATTSANNLNRFDPFQGTSRAICQLAEDAQKVAQADAPILILGETGVGKGVLARWLHMNGPRAEESFVDTNCAGFSSELFDTELFGHERGAFTGAVATKQGLVEVAHKGILFLDEIGDMSLQTQPKLLKVIEEQRFRRVGSVKDRIVDVRIIAATNRDLAKSVDEGEFRQDLYYRINMFPLQIPALRERPSDIVALAQTILSRMAVTYHQKNVSLTYEATQLLIKYSWPGNVRELRNVLERSLLLAGSSTIDVRDLRLPQVAMSENELNPRVLSMNLIEVERRHIERVLSANHGNVVQTAKILGISRSAFYDKLKKHNIGLSASRSSDELDPEKQATTRK